MFKGTCRDTNYLTIESQNLEIKSKNAIRKPIIPEGMWTKCKKCGEIIYTKDLKENKKVCNLCKYHFRLTAKERIEQIVDNNTWQEINANLSTLNPLDFPGYEEKINRLYFKTKLKEAVVTGIGDIYGQKAVICVMDSHFLMGSMGSVVGEKITRAVELAISKSLPLIIFTASGGARMQEGMYSLMQMAKVSAAISKLHRKGLLYITVITDPTTGGVTASFAMLGDIILSEPGALIGFAGKRVIEQTINRKLPDGFQTAEFLLEHGFIDKIVTRSKLKSTLGTLLQMHNHKKKRFTKVEKRCVDINNTRNNLDAWERLNLVRKIERPTALDYITRIFDCFIELHGDRYFGDDKCIIGGIGYLKDIPVTIIANQKGRDLKENIDRNFGMANPEGYRKSLRLMKQAEKFKRPIICFVDTPGAYCGIGAEERGQGEAIARNLFEMAELKVPIISIIIGEGGSGGALALAAGDRVWMLENAIYAPLSPEGFASILWKDASKAKKAANLMKITAEDLKRFGIIDKILIEPHNDASKDIDKMSEIIKVNLINELSELQKLSIDELLDNRYSKFRNIGEYSG